jgi:endoglycosylceramidase
MKRALLIALAGGLVLVAPASAAGPVPPVGHEGRWITDAHGRVVILHGFNMVYKRPPYYPKATGFGADDAKFLIRHGFDAIRLGVIYKAVEPRPAVHGRPSYNDAYLAKIANTQRTLARHGVFSLIDFHQDMYNEKFQGEGWPDWQVQDDGLPNPRNGFPGNYLTNPALWRAYDHFWANDRVGGAKLLDRYAAAWRHVARAFQGRNRILGYDILNEPFPGSQLAACANPAGCPAFDTGPLATMTRKTTQAIRKVDRRHLVWHEPLVTFNFGAETHLPRIGPNSGLSFHPYGCLTPPSPECESGANLVFDNADSVAKTTDRALLDTEFGATDDLATLDWSTALADQHMVSWLEWAYCGCKDPTGSIPPAAEGLVKDPSKPPRGKNVKRKKLKVLDRPYPQAVAGTPTGFGFNPKTDVFHLAYRAKPPGGRRLSGRRNTRVYVPHSHYPHGYRAKVSGARVFSEPGARYLLLRRKASASQVELEISPRR